MAVVTFLPKDSDKVSPGDLVLCYARMHLVTLKVLEVRSSEIIAKDFLDEDEVKVDLDYIVDHDHPNFSKMFSPRSLVDMKIPQSGYRGNTIDVKKGDRIVLLNGILYTGSVASANSDNMEIELDDFSKIIKVNYSDRVWAVKTDLHFGVVARGLTRVSRLNLGNLDY